MILKEKNSVNSEFDTLFDLSDQEQEEVDAKVLAAQFLAVVDETLEARNLNRKDFAALLGTSASWLTQLSRGDKLSPLTPICNRCCITSRLQREYSQKKTRR